MIVIGIASNCYAAGKTTLANNLRDMFNNKYGIGCAAVCSFAAPLKHHANALIEPIVGKGPYDKEAIVLGDANYRDILLGLGQLMRSFDTNFWIKYAVCSMNSLTPRPSVVLIDDMRFPNEIKFIKEYGTQSNDNQSMTLYINNETYKGASQNGAEGLIHPSECNIELLRRKAAPDTEEGLHNARMAFPIIESALNISPNPEQAAGFEL